MHLLTTLRRGAGSGLVAAVVSLGLTVPAASGAELDCSDPDAVAAAVESARADAVAARKAFKATNRPLGQLVKAARHDARDTAKESRAAIAVVRKQARDRSLSADERAALRAEAKRLRAELRGAKAMLEDKRVLLAEIKADRREAKAAWDEAKAVWHDVKAAAEACETEEPPVEEEPVEPPAEEPAP